MTAFAVVVYLRSEFFSCLVYVLIVAAKLKLAPLKDCLLFHRIEFDSVLPSLLLKQVKLDLECDIDGVFSGVTKQQRFVNLIQRRVNLRSIKRLGEIL